MIASHIPNRLPKHLEIAALCSLIAGGFFGSKYLFRSHYMLEINPERDYFPTDFDKSNKPKSVILNYTQLYYPYIVEAHHKSLRCLEKKGYKLAQRKFAHGWVPICDTDTVYDRVDDRVDDTQYPDLPEPLIRITNINRDKEIDIDDFLKVCKECNVYTEIRAYSWKQHEVVSMHRHDWHTCYNEREID